MEIVETIEPTKVNRDARIPLLKRIEEIRKGRKLICFFNFDRNADPPIPGLNAMFASDTKEALFRVLKESCKEKKGIDLCLYTRGGDTNSVWPIVSLIREFDPDFQILVPFRCHSSGTLVALGSKKIVLGPLSELSPIDPTIANQFNPRDPTDNKKVLAISVEDVRAYKNFVSTVLRTQDKLPKDLEKNAGAFLEKLVSQVHPLALGNVQRALLQIQQLAKSLLDLHGGSTKSDNIVETLTEKFYSHVHMINRNEAKSILGNRVEFASDELAAALDELMYAYVTSFKLRHTFFLSSKLAGNSQINARFIAGVIESIEWGYKFCTVATIRQFSRIPPNIQVQIPPGESIPLIPGLPRETEVEIHSQSWVRNERPEGVTL